MKKMKEINENYKKIKKNRKINEREREKKKEPRHELEDINR